MEGSFADELYSESLQLSKIQLDPTSSAKSKQSDSHDHDGVELCDEDGLGDGCEDELYDLSKMDSEWKKRRDHFHTIGCREGVIAGKEASSQEGFNIGFKQSLLIGYKWGLVRGVTSALACLRDDSREKLIETEEQRTGFQGLFESVHSLSTADSLRLFNEEIIATKARERTENPDTSSLEASFPEQITDVGGLGILFAKLQSLLNESPAINMHLS